MNRHRLPQVPCPRGRAIRRVWGRPGVLPERFGPEAGVEVLEGEAGSGSVLGIMLVFLIASILAAVCFAGRVYLTQERAQQAADVAALAASSADNGLDGRNDPCSVAKSVAGTNGATLVRCEKKGDDMVVSVVISTRLPLVDSREATARAGPQLCGER